MTDERFSKVRSADPPDLWPEIERRILRSDPVDSRSLGPRGRGGWRIAVGIAAALAVVAASLVLVWTTFSDRTPSASPPATSAPPQAFVVRVATPAEDARVQLPQATVSFAGTGGRMSIDTAGGAWKTPQAYEFTRMLVTFGSDVPIGAPIAIGGDATSVSARIAGQGASGAGSGARIGLRSGIGHLPERPGSYLLEVSATWPDRSATFAIGIRLSGPVFVIRLTAPPPGSPRYALPSAVMSYGGVTGKMKVDGEGMTWPCRDPCYFTLELPTLTDPIPPGTILRVVGDAERTSASVVVVRPDGSNGPTVPIELTDGIGRLPSEPGGYVLRVVGHWLQGDVGFVLGIGVSGR